MASRIEQLAATIAEGTGTIGTHLRDNSLPFPSFDVDGPTNPVLDGEAEYARHNAMAACMELLDLLQGPQMCIRPCYNGAPLQIIYKYGLAQKVPFNGMISFTDLASTCGMHETDLRQIIRYSIVYHRCFKEPEKGMVAHSAASRQLAENSDVQAGVGYMFDGNFQSFGRVYDAIELGKGKPKEPNQAGWALARNSGGSFFDDLEADHDLANRFQSALRFFTATVPGHHPKLLVEAYPWADLPQSSTVVDVGGGDGTVGTYLARSHPELKVIVQDQPHIVQHAEASTKAPANMEFQACDFFKSQPVHGAQAYILRWILHDWPDNYAIKILQTLVPALEKGTKLVINDYIGPGQAGNLPLIPERLVREMDMVMLSNHNTYEREMEDWERIFKEADSRFGPLKCTRLPMTLMAIIEVEWNP